MVRSLAEGRAFGRFALGANYPLAESMVGVMAETLLIIAGLFGLLLVCNSIGRFLVWMRDRDRERKQWGKDWRVRK